MFDIWVHRPPIAKRSAQWRRGAWRLQFPLRPKLQGQPYSREAALCAASLTTPRCQGRLSNLSPRNAPQTTPPSPTTPPSLYTPWYYPCAWSSTPAQTWPTARDRRRKPRCLSIPPRSPTKKGATPRVRSRARRGTHHVPKSKTSPGKRYPNTG